MWRVCVCVSMWVHVHVCVDVRVCNAWIVEAREKMQGKIDKVSVVHVQLYL